MHLGVPRHVLLYVSQVLPAPLPIPMMGLSISVKAIAVDAKNRAIFIATSPRGDATQKRSQVLKFSSSKPTALVPVRC